MAKYGAPREQRQKEGDERNAKWRALTPAEKLASLDARLGPGKGARRQRCLLKKGK